MKVTFSMRLDEDLRGRLERKALLEGRTLANLIERLLELGLGTVVTMNGGGGDAGLRPLGTQSPGLDLPPLPLTAANCPKRGTTHNPGTKCNECGTQFPAREFKPDFKGKP